MLRVEKSYGSSISEDSGAASSFSRSARPFFFRRIGFEEKHLEAIEDRDGRFCEWERGVVSRVL